MLNRFPLKAAAIALFALSIPALATAQTQAPPGTGTQPGAHMKMGGGMPHMSRRASRFIKLYDLDQDGKVTLEEINKDQRLIFQALDIDGDKSLSVEEMKRRGRSLQLWHSMTMFDLMDVNGDRKLSLDELTQPTGRWFKRYDVNQNGVLEASELPERSGRRGRGGRYRR